VFLIILLLILIIEIMKSFIVFLIAIVVIGFVACSSKDLSTVEVSVLYDITEKKSVVPNIDEIISLYNFENKYNGGVFKLIEITDVSFNPVLFAKIDAENRWLSNEMDRDKKIKGFKSRVSEFIVKAGKDSSGKDNSSIYLPIAAELNKLAGDKVNLRRVLIVYSDLMENTNELSFYKKEDFELLNANPEKVKSYFEKLLKLNSISGIEVYFIYQPINNIDDQDYRLVSGFYRKLLESKGAKVNISANINL